MTGMRRDEVLGLRWRDLSLVRGRLSVRQALVAVGYEVVHSTPKSRGTRVIDLDDRTVNQLRAHRRRQDDERTDLGCRLPRPGPGHAQGEGRADPPAHVQPVL